MLADLPCRSWAKPGELYLVWVSVVVVVTGAGVVVCCVVVVELCEALSVPHPLNDTRAAAAMQERMNVFINVFVVWFVDLQNEFRQSVGYTLWGVTLPSQGGAATPPCRCAQVRCPQNKRPETFSHSRPVSFGKRPLCHQRAPPSGHRPGFPSLNGLLGSDLRNKRYRPTIGRSFHPS